MLKLTGNLDRLMNTYEVCSIIVKSRKYSDDPHKYRVLIDYPIENYSKYGVAEEMRTSMIELKIKMQHHNPFLIKTREKLVHSGKDLYRILTDYNRKDFFDISEIPASIVLEIEKQLYKLVSQNLIQIQNKGIVEWEINEVTNHEDL